MKTKKKRPKLKLKQTQVTFKIGGSAGKTQSDGRDIFKWLCSLDDVGKGRIAQQYRE